MKLVIHSKDGVTEKELTQQEIESYAAKGVLSCQQELIKQNIKNSVTISDKLNYILEYLGL